MESRVVLKTMVLDCRLSCADVVWSMEVRKLARMVSTPVSSTKSKRVLCEGFRAIWEARRLLEAVPDLSRACSEPFPPGTVVTAMLLKVVRHFFIFLSASSSCDRTSRKLVSPASNTLSRPCWMARTVTSWACKVRERKVVRAERTVS